MGKPLAEMLYDNGFEVYVTSRRERQSDNGIQFLKGNAKDIEFLKSVLLEETRERFDCVVDFMAYNTKEFEERYLLFLENCKQYVFISSARVYAECPTLITEDSPRLLDVIDDTDYLKTDEYAIAKARQENLLNNSGYSNFTIVRPSITYNDYRFQLGVLEKEHWLYRALQGRTIVFSKDIAEHLTAMTYGADVIRGIYSVIGNEDCLGESYHITESCSYTWNDILEVYLNAIESKTGKRPKVKMTDKSTCFKVGWNKYQIIYCRYYDRSFDNAKIGQYVNVDSFRHADEQLSECIGNFIDNPSFGQINWLLEAVNDRITHEWTPLSEIPGKKDKAKYLIYRLRMEWALKILKAVR